MILLKNHVIDCVPSLRRREKIIWMSQKIKSICKNTSINHQPSYFSNVLFCVLSGNGWRKKSHEINWPPLEKNIFTFWLWRLVKIARINCCVGFMHVINRYFVICKMIHHPDFLSTIFCSFKQNYWILPKLDANFHGQAFKLVDIYSFCFLFCAAFTGHEIICWVVSLNTWLSTLFWSSMSLINEFWNSPVTTNLLDLHDE